MSYTILIRPEAESDLQESFQWYQEQSPGLGYNFIDCLDAAFDAIVENPNLYQKIYKDVRRVFPERFPHGIFYLIDGNKIVVLAVLHAKRNPQIFKDRIS